ncbi:unnamed protein product, partial [Pylaiella littoralis]
RLRRSVSAGPPRQNRTSCLGNEAGAARTGIERGISFSCSSSATLPAEHSALWRMLCVWSPHLLYGVQSENRTRVSTERECMAILWAVDHFKPYLAGRAFRLVTDCSALTWLFRS